MKCELCGGELGVFGVLGNMVWLECRDCGDQPGLSLSDIKDPQLLEAISEQGDSLEAA